MRTKINNFNKINYLPKGFTLIELLVVVSIISLLSSITLATFRAAQTGAKIAALQQDANNIITQIDIARNASGETVNQLDAGICTFCFIDNQTKLKDANDYSLSQIQQSWTNLGFSTAPKDPWGDPFIIRPKEGVSGGGCYYYDQVYSAGPDGYLPTYSLPIPYAFSMGPVGVVTPGSSDDYVFSVPFYLCPGIGYYPQYFP